MQIKSDVRPAAPLSKGAAALVREPSFHDLLIQTLPTLRLRAMALTRNRADADDLVQAAVSNALAGQNSFQAGTNFKAWMTRILRNRFFSNIRARRETVELDDVPGWRLGRSGGQEEGLELQELQRAMARLPAQTRLLLLMISVEGVSYEDASAQLGLAVGTLKCRGVPRAPAAARVDDGRRSLVAFGATRRTGEAATRTC